MTDIDELGDQEKSVLLAKAAPDLWTIYEDDYVAGRIWIKHHDYHYATTNLYRVEFMFLAWRVLNWATDPDGPWSFAIAAGDFELEGWLFSNPIWRKAKAQRAWLDEILELVIEAGLVEVNETHQELT